MDKLKKNNQQSNENNKKINIKNKINLKNNKQDSKNELKKVKEENLRLLAEIDNLRKRFDKEREDTFKYAVTEFANEIILVADNFGRVIDSINLVSKNDDNNIKSFTEGVDLIYKDFIKTLEKFGIKKIDCLGKKFDPNFHQAVSEEETNAKNNGEIIKIIQSGYLINDRLLRPASVIIAKKVENKKK